MPTIGWIRIQRHKLATTAIAVAVELQPFGFLGLEVCFTDLEIPRCHVKDKDWHERIERLVFHPRRGDNRDGTTATLTRSVGYWLLRQIYCLRTVEIVAIPSPQNGNYHRIQFDGINHSRLGVVQTCYHNSERLVFHVKIMLGQHIAFFVIIYFIYIYKESVEIYTSEKPPNGLAGAVFKIFLVVMASLGAIYSALAGTF
ncbi:hypothetical protein TWF506_003028 [Arthrobotrys conoides]|uniref:Uncharacterized protein n=1 Tax=Arthrobotrys conoides TaxID=74498 RepID=A0AAN8MYK7_9PEZI